MFKKLSLKEQIEKERAEKNALIAKQAEYEEALLELAQIVSTNMEGQQNG